MKTCQLILLCIFIFGVCWLSFGFWLARWEHNQRQRRQEELIASSQQKEAKEQKE